MSFFKRFIKWVKTMKVALYARVSTDEQAKDGYSIGAQCKKLQQYADLHDWETVLYVDDGYSAKDLNRPQISKLFKDIESGKIDTVVVYKLDRLTRSVRNLYDLMDLFASENCKFISLTESLDTSNASGRFFITMLGAMAQWERETIGERTAIGIKEAVKSGKVSSRAPFGYRRANGGFIIDEKEAYIVQSIFERYNSGVGVDLLIKELQSEGIIPLDKSWCATKILRILNNRSYLGEFTVKFKDGDVVINKDIFPPIISNQLFDDVSLLLKKKKRLPRRAKGTSRLFSGVLTCHECGAPIFGNTPEGFRYKCQNKSKSRGCSCGTFYEKELEEHFINYITELLNSVNDESIGTFKTEALNKRIRLSKELERIKHIKLKNHTAYENDLISFNLYKSRIDELKARESEINDILSHETTPPKILDFKGSDFRVLWETLDRKDKRNMVLKYIKNISMYKFPVSKTLGKLEIYHIDFL